MTPIEAYRFYRARADAAYRVFESYCTRPPIRVPGCDTAIRLAVRIDAGRSTVEAAAKEFIYRWNLALGGTAWAADMYAPSTLGM